jgi:enoyl-CoA hydratase/carnithine racemase
LVTRLYAQEGFASETDRFAAELAKGATRALALTKRALYSGSAASLEEQLDVEATLQQAASMTDDFAEGLAAFREKRAPDFRGS